MAQPRSGRPHKLTECNCQNATIRSFMKWVSMAEQPHTSLRSPCTMPSIGWRCLKLPAFGLWSDELLFTILQSDRRIRVWRFPGECYMLECIVPTGKFGVWRRNNGLELFFIFRAWLLSSKGNLNATAYNYILDDSVFPTLWQQFGEGPFLFQHDNAPVHKARSIHKWFVEISVEELETSEP